MNVDDKAHDDLSVSLSEVAWKSFSTHLWDRWRQEIRQRDGEIDRVRKRYVEIPQEIAVLRSLHRTGQVTEFEYEEKLEMLRNEADTVRRKLYGR